MLLTAVVANACYFTLTCAFASEQFRQGITPMGSLKRKKRVLAFLRSFESRDMYRGSLPMTAPRKNRGSVTVDTRVPAVHRRRCPRDLA